MRAQARGALVALVLLAFSLLGTSLWADAPSLADQEAEAEPERRGPAWREAPFCVGEEATYSVRFGILKGGEMVLRVLPGEEVRLPSEFRVAAQDTWRFNAAARTSKLIGIFYRVDDVVDVVVDRRSFLPLRFELAVRESVEIGTRTVLFDHARRIADYRKDRTFHKRLGPDLEEREDDLPPTAIDSLSLAFLLRHVELRPDTVFYQAVHDKGHTWDARVRVGAVEKVSSPYGKMRAFPLEVRVALGKKLETLRDVRLWVSDDARRLVVRFEADLKFGTLKGVLTDYVPGG